VPWSPGRFIQQYDLPEYDADILTGERSLSEYFESAVKAYAGDPKRVSNWLMNDVLRMINESGVPPIPKTVTSYLAEIISCRCRHHQHNTGNPVDKVQRTVAPLLRSSRRMPGESERYSAIRAVS